MFRRGRRGFTLVELLLILGMFGVLYRLGAQGLRTLRTQQGGERVGQAVLWETTMARSYAVRYGNPLSLVANRNTLQLITRDSFGNVYRTVSFDRLSELPATSLSTNVAGDSLIFSAAGMCLNCGNGTTTGTTTLTVVASGRSYAIRVNPLGRAESPSLRAY